MTYTAQPSINFEQRLAIIRRHLHGLTLALDALECEMQARQAGQQARRIAALEAAIVAFLNRIDTLPFHNTLDGKWVSLTAEVWEQFNYQDCEQLRLAANPAPAPQAEQEPQEVKRL